MRDRKEYMKEFILDGLRQLFGFTKPRTEQIIFTHYAWNKLTEFSLDPDTVINAYRYGTERKKDMIVHKYRNYQIGMYIKPYELKENHVLIITVWKREV